MNNESYDFKLGDVVQDVITEFKGVIVVHLRYLYNHDRYGVRSRELHEGRPIEPVFFDGTSLKFIEATDLEAPEFPEIDIQLSDEVKDKVGAFKGSVIGHGFWINGCVRIGIQSKELNKEGHPVEEQWFPMNQVALVKRGKEGKIQEEKKKVKNPGGPMKNPTSMRNPKY